MFLYLLYARYEHRKLLIQYDVNDIDITDFSIMVENVGKHSNCDYKVAIKNLFENRIIDNRKSPVI